MKKLNCLVCDDAFDWKGKGRRPIYCSPCRINIQKTRSRECKQRGERKISVANPDDPLPPAMEPLYANFYANIGKKYTKWQEVHKVLATL